MNHASKTVAARSETQRTARTAETTGPLQHPTAAAPVPAQSANSPGENIRAESPEPTANISDELKPEKLFGSFELRRELENGGMGATWLAEDYSVKRHANEVALKFLPACIVSDVTAFEELKSEIRRTIALRHPNILRIYDLVEFKGRVAIEMEYQDGQSLSQLRVTRPNQIFEVRDLEKWVQPLCDALEYAHNDVGILHGAIDPENLIVDSAGNLKLKGFRTANRIANLIGRLTAGHHNCETVPCDCRPRPAIAEPAVTDDLFSLGATLYELLTGKTPFNSGDIGATENGQVPAPMTARRAELGIEGETIPNNWEKTVAACLAKDPVNRPQSAGEVKRRLNNGSSPSVITGKSNADSVVSSSGRPQPAVPTPRIRKPRVAIACTIIFLALAFTTAFFAVHRRVQPRLGRIVLDTIPAQANVILDGASRGTTPLVIEDVSPGDHQLRIERYGNEKKTLTVTVKGGNQESVQLIRLVALKEPSPASPILRSESPENEITVSATTPSPAATPIAISSPLPALVENATPSPQETPNENRSAGPSPTPPSQPDIDSTKDDVMKRIEALPGVTAEMKANLLEKMQKARSMERLTVIPFGIGQSSLHRAATDELVKAFDAPEMRDRLSDPTTVLVVAGYSDTGGRPDLNLRLSQERAANVSKILREQAMLGNAIQTIGMGGTELLDSGRPDQNRAVEVWAVVPL